MTPRRKQEGLTLLIALVMLVVITLFVVSMIKLGGTSASIVGNMQAQKAITGEAQQAVEIALNSYTFFDDVIQQKNAWVAGVDYLTYTALWTNYKPSTATAQPPTQATDLKIYRPQCVHFEIAAGYSALSGVAPQDTYWDIRVDASDSFTQATTEIHQGLRMRLPPGNCP